MIRYFLGYLNIFDKTLSMICLEAGSIYFYLEAEAINHIDLSWWETVQLSHTLYFSELNMIAVLELVSLVFMDCDNDWIGLSCISNDERFSLFSISIINEELFSIIQEGKSTWTKETTIDESN